MISATDMAKMRAITVASLDTPLIIDRPTNTSGVWGNNTESFTNIAGGISGNPAVLATLLEPTVQEISGSGGSASESQQWTIRVPNGTNIQQNDKITTPTGLVLRVQGLHTPTTSYRPIDIFMASVSR